MNRHRRELLCLAAGGAAWLGARRAIGASFNTAPDSRIEVLLNEPIGTIAPEIYGHFVEHLGGVGEREAADRYCYQLASERRARSGNRYQRRVDSIGEGGGPIGSRYSQLQYIRKPARSRAARRGTQGKRQHDRSSLPSGFCDEA
jgi:hypothetical protein